MTYPNNFMYTKDHEWAKLEDDNEVTVGITYHAQESLGDIVYVELPSVGRKLKSHETFGVVESIKAVSDLYSPLEGEVIATNSTLTEDSSKLNSDPHGSAWIMKLKISNPNALKELMSAEQYTAYVSSLK